MTVRQNVVVCACVILAFPGVLTAGEAGHLKAPPGCRPVEGTVAEPYTGTGFAKEVVHEKSGITLLFVPPGRLKMGPWMGDPNRGEVNVHIARRYYMGKYEVTNAEFKRFVSATEYDGKSDSDSFYYDFLKHFRGESIMPTADGFPVVWVNWKHAKAYCEWARLRLPSEAEWEYACRAGTTTRYSFGDDPSHLVKYGWCTDNSEGSTHEVGKKPANNWGFHDMHGNVLEWCEDDFVLGYAGVPADGSAYVAGRMTKVLRGSAWDCNHDRATPSASRFNSGPTNAQNNIGFRVALNAQ